MKKGKAMREKLIDLIRKADKEDHESRTQDEHYRFMADRLMESGVTIPVRCCDCKVWTRYEKGAVSGRCGFLCRIYASQKDTDVPLFRRVPIWKTTTEWDLSWVEFIQNLLTNGSL